jgi:hypothetical protein
MNMATTPLETLLAIKAICLHRGLNSNERRVGAALIEHFNRRTGQCDPGIARLAKLLGLSQRTIVRSINGLSRYGLFMRIRHGGRLGRNFYVPLWSQFRMVCAFWDQLMKNGRLQEGTALSQEYSQGRPTGGVRPGNQTYLNNLHTSTYYGLSKQNHTDEPGSAHKIAQFGQSGQSAREAAATAAERRWNTALHDRFSNTPELYGQVIEAIDETIQAAATAAEMNKQGAGIAYILEQLHAQGLSPLGSA